MALASVEDIRKMLYPPWYRRINWGALFGMLVCFACAVGVCWLLIWGAVDGWKHVGVGVGR